MLEDGQLKRSDAGTPQGGVISPLLANVYLHHVLDVWFESEVRPRIPGQVFLVRYADDVAIVFAREDDARRVMAVLPHRFGKYGLTLHPEKTRLVRFQQPPYRWQPGRHGNSAALGFERPGTFDLLGFTHYWGPARVGGWGLFRRTAKSRFRRSVRAVYEWLRRHRHLPLREQHDQLSMKLRGHSGYYGITGNYRRLEAFRHAVVRAWHKWLNRRSQGNHMPWDRYLRFLARDPLPSMRVVHSVFPRAAKPCY